MRYQAGRLVALVRSHRYGGMMGTLLRTLSFVLLANCGGGDIARPDFGEPVLFNSSDGGDACAR